MKLISLYILIFVLLSGCAPINEPLSSPPVNSHVEEISLFMSRKELSRTPFEQIKLSENTLFKECGNIKRGRFYATEQEVTFVTVTQRDRLDSLAAELRIYLKTHTFRPERPGDNSSLFDPGRLSLSVEYKDGETVSFETSLDSVSNASRGSEKRIKKLVSALRGAAGGILCGRKEFFGIGS